jgi:hypothetical protein
MNGIHEVRGSIPLGSTNQSISWGVRKDALCYFMTYDVKRD